MTKALKSAKEQKNFALLNAWKSNTGMPLIKAIVRDIWSVHRVQMRKRQVEFRKIYFFTSFVSFQSENLTISRCLCNKGLLGMTAILRQFNM